MRHGALMVKASMLVHSHTTSEGVTEPNPIRFHAMKGLIHFTFLLKIITFLNCLLSFGFDLTGTVHQLWKEVLLLWCSVRWGKSSSP